MAQIDGVKSRVIIDERLDSQRFEDLQYNILKGPSDILTKVDPSTSFSNGQISWNISSPNLESALDRRVILSVQCLFTITTENRSDEQGPIFNTLLNPNGSSPGYGVPWVWSPVSILTTAGTAVTQNNNPLQSICALRSDCPFQKRCNVITVGVNTQQLNYQPFDYLEALLRYTADYDYSNRAISSLGYRDNYQSYSIPFNNSLVNPLAGFGNAFVGRGIGFDSLQITNININQSEVLIGWSELLMVPPFIQSLNDKPGLMGLEKLNIIMTMSDVANMLSINEYEIAGLNNPVVNGVTVTGNIYNNNMQPTLYTNWLYSEVSAPQYNLVNKYPISVFNQYSVSSGGNTSVPSGSIYKSQSQTILLSSIPSDLYIFVQESKQARSTPTATDTFAPIQSINITLGTRSGILANATQDTLYSMSVRNGLKLSYAEFIANVGSPIRISLSKDLPILRTLAVGSQQRITLMATVTYQNPKEYASQFDTYLVVSDEGILELFRGSGRLLTSLVTSEDLVTSAIEKGDVDTVKVNEDDIIGGNSIGQNVRHYARSAYNVGRKAYDLYDKHKDTINPLIAKYGPTIAQLTQHFLGLGYSHAEAQRKARNHHRKGKGLVKAKGLVAGNMIQRNDTRLISSLQGARGLDDRS